MTKPDISPEAVERFMPIDVGGCGPLMDPCSDGNWVRYSDYTAVCAERDALQARAEAAEAEALDWRAQVGELSDKLKALAAERDALQARVDAAEADLELESEWALAQPNADPMRELVEAVAKGPLPGEDMRRWIERRMKEAVALRDLEQGDT